MGRVPLFPHLSWGKTHLERGSLGEDWKIGNARELANWLAGIFKCNSILALPLQLSGKLIRLLIYWILFSFGHRTRFTVAPKTKPTTASTRLQSRMKNKSDIHL